VEPLFTPSQLAEVRAYHDVRYLANAVDALSWLLVLGLMARYGARPLYRLSERLVSRWRSIRLLEVMWGGPSWAESLVFALAMLALVTLLYLPVNLYFGYVREHAFGLSTESLGSYALDELKRFSLTGAAIAALAFGLFGLARRLPAWWWVMGIVASALMALATSLDPYRARVYVDQAPLEAGPLRERINAMMAKAGVDFREVLVEETLEKSVQVQAYFAGQGPTRAIVINDALLKVMSEDEVLAAIAHEAAHVHEPRWPGRVGSTLALISFLWVIELVFRSSGKRGWFGASARADVRTLPFIFLLFELATLVIAPISGWQSRARELAADRFGVELTADPAAFRSMLIKVARVNKMDPSPPRWVVWRGLSHPPIADRIAKAEGERAH